MKKVFLIHRGVDRSRVTGFKGLIDDLNGYEGVYDREDVRHEGPAAIKQYLQELMKPCSIVALLIGDDSHNGRYLEYELSLSRNWGKKRVAFRISGTTGGLPAEWKNAGIKIFGGKKSVVKKVLDSL